MALAARTRLGPYEIVAPIGAGGMGEVYKARDTKLDREVAIKVLPAAFAQDPERLARFEREAKVLAALNHPNIAQIYGFEESDGIRALAMELVPGGPPKGPLPMEIALNYAKQIAEALEAAHEKGVTHRDLKPVNIMITPEGVVKVLDFGLASIPSREGGSNPTNSPTMTMAATQAGMIMGTAAYMSPEQAAGKVVDKRSDIWSFGVVLWEMITGAQLFSGETISHTLADVLRAPIDFASLPAATPAPIAELLQRCLDRDVKTRLRDIGEARVTIQKCLANPKGAMQSASTESRTPSRWAWAVAGALAITTAVALWMPWRAAPELPKPVRFQIAPPPGVIPAGVFSISPDGTKLAYVGFGSDGVSRLWVRTMDTLESHALAGVEMLNVPLFWSPDSRFIAFDTGGKLKKQDLAGGPLQTLCDVPATVVGGSWNRDGVIVFGLNNGAGIQRVSSAGGAPSLVTAMNAARNDRLHLFPVFLPDGRHFLYLVRSAASENSGVYLGALDSKPDQPEPKRLVATGFSPGFVPFPDGKGGAILFQSGGTLLAQPFDLRRLETTGEAVPLAEQLGSYIGFGYFAASDNGILAYRDGASGGTTQLGWFDRQGKRLGVVGTAHNYRGPASLALSPDGTRVAAARTDGNNFDIWLTAFSRASDTRFTFDPASDLNPVWSPDGNRIAFSSDRAGQFDLYQNASNGAGQDQLLFKSDHVKVVEDWSRDGRFLLYYDVDPKTKSDLWVLPMDGASSGEKQGGRKPVPFLRTDFDEQNAKFSPDGHWVAYQSDESGRNEIYVRPFPAADGGGKWTVSQGGGTQPRWRGDSKELFYLAPDGNVMAVPVSTSVDGFQPGTLAALFKGPPNADGWDVSADGKRFLFPVPAGESAQAPFTIVQNWISLLKK